MCDFSANTDMYVKCDLQRPPFFPVPPEVSVMQKCKHRWHVQCRWWTEAYFVLQQCNFLPSLNPTESGKNLWNHEWGDPQVSLRSKMKRYWYICATSQVHLNTKLPVQFWHLEMKYTNIKIAFQCQDIAGTPSVTVILVGVVVPLVLVIVVVISIILICR